MSSRPGSSARVLRAVLGSPALRRVLAAFLVFNAAEYGTWVAMLVYAYEASGPAAVGVVALVQLLPAAVFAPVAASLADRYPRERVLLAGYLAQAAGFAAVTAGMALGAPPPLVYAAGVSVAAAITFTRPAQGALLPSLAGTPEELTAANSMAGTVEGIGVLAGPLAAAAILAVGTPAHAWAAGTLACVGAALLVAGIRRRDGGAGPVRQTPPDDGPIALVVDGLRIAARAGPTRLVMALLGIRMLTSGALDILFVLLAIEVYGTGEAGAGILAAALGLGTILGGAASLSLVGRRRLAPALALSAATFGLPMLLVASVGPPVIAPVLIALAGIGFASIDVIGRTILQRVTPDRHLARILGALEGLGLVFLSIGSVLVPVATGWTGVEATLGIAAALLPVAVLVAWLPLRRIDRHAHVPVREIALLRRNAIFAPLPAPQLETVARRTRWITVREGEVLIREGDPGDRFYVVESGELEVSIGGRPVRITGGPGEGIGEVALLRGVARTASVTALGPCVLLALDRVDFLAAVTGHAPAQEAAEAAAASRAMAAG